jgi:hypothetical protein
MAAKMLARRRIQFAIAVVCALLLALAGIIFLAKRIF